MTSALEKRVRRLQDKYGDALLTALTLILLLLMFVVAPLRAADYAVAEAAGLVFFLLLIVVALAVSGNLVSFALMFVTLAVNVVVAVRRALHQPAYNMHLLAAAWLLFAVTLGWIVAHAVFAAGRVTYHRVVGAVLLYLLIAANFAVLFLVVGLAIPHAFSGLVLADGPALTSDLIYFSIVTLTSTGYGDIAPVHPIARSLCNIESIVGQLYPATLLARLVTLELEHRR
jgi:hypothetical protein